MTEEEEEKQASSSSSSSSSSPIVNGEDKKEVVEGKVNGSKDDEGRPTSSLKKEHSQRGGYGGGGGGRRRDETPIEELYDLSQPIKRVERPSKEEHEKQIALLTSTIDNLKKSRQTIQSKIDAFMDPSRNTEISDLRDTLSRLRSKKGSLIDQKKQIRHRLDATREQTDKLVKDRKDTKSGLFLSSSSSSSSSSLSSNQTPQQIDEEIAKLKRKQETTSMSLADEKRLLRTIEHLQTSKDVLTQLRKKDHTLDSIRDQRSTITLELRNKDSEIDAVQSEIEARSSEMDVLRSRESESRKSLQDLFRKRDSLKKEMNERLDERTKCRSEFRRMNQDWYNYQRALRAKKRIVYEEEKRKKDEERAAWLKMKEEEEMKKVPYEEEMALCDYLVGYLTRTYLTNGDHHKVEKKPDEDKNREIKDDPFAGITPLNHKKKDDQDDFYMSNNTHKKKKKKKSKKSKRKSEVITLNVDSFEQFGLLNLNPPTTLDSISKSVEELKAKKIWYSQQPRGSVPTAHDIRKANEKKNKTRRGRGDDQSDVKKINGKNGTSDGKSKNKGFELSDDDFAPLGGVAAAAAGVGGKLNASWGQQQKQKEEEQEEAQQQQQQQQEEEGDKKEDTAVEVEEDEDEES